MYKCKKNKYTSRQTKLKEFIIIRLVLKEILRKSFPCKGNDSEKNMEMQRMRNMGNGKYVNKSTFFHCANNIRSGGV